MTCEGLSHDIAARGSVASGGHGQFLPVLALRRPAGALCWRALRLATHLSHSADVTLPSVSSPGKWGELLPGGEWWGSWRRTYIQHNKCELPSPTPVFGPPGGPWLSEYVYRRHPREVLGPRGPVAVPPSLGGVCASEGLALVPLPRGGPTRPCSRTANPCSTGWVPEGAPRGQQRGHDAEPAASR